MIDVSFVQLQEWLELFLWPFVRITSFMMAAPLLGHGGIPVQVKIGLAGLIAIAVYPVLPPLPQVALISWPGLGILFEQMLIGISIGLTLRIVLTAVQAAGEYISLQMGLGFATFFDSASGTNTVVVSRLLYMVTLLLFLAMNGHLVIIEILASTFVSLPIGFTDIPTSAMELPARFATVIFFAGTLLSLPIVAPLLIVKITLGVLNRSAPQFTVFSIGFPMSLIGGIALLIVLMSDMGRFVERLFNQGIQYELLLIEKLAG